MSQILTDAGTLYYNGVTFDGASHLSIQCEPVADEANRTITHHRYKIHVEGVVGDPSSTDLDMLTLRANLTKQGQELRIENKGFGSLIVNGSGGVNDVAFGPKPKLLSWKPIGAAKAAEIVWECETDVAFCSQMVSPTGIIALNYRVDYSLDHRGLTTRTISGYLEIAMTRVAGGSAIPDTADTYRSQIKPTIPERFQRVTQTFNLSLDKRRLDFTIVDQEIPSNNPYPNGAVKVEAKHSVVWNRRGGGAAKMRNRLTLDVELSPDQPLLNAYVIFLNIISARKAAAQNNEAPVLLENFSIEEDLFARGASFSCTYTLLKPLDAILTATGLWTPLSLNTWSEWAVSIENVSDVGGYANLRHLAANDAIVDVCQGSVTLLSNYSRTEKTQETLSALENSVPPPDNSWMEYDCHVLVDRQRPVARLAVLQSPDDDDPDWNPDSTAGAQYNTQGGVNDTFQRAGRARYSAWLTGKALRAGYPIPKPAITSVGGVQAVELGGRFATKIVANMLGVPIYGATWAIEYGLPNAPGTVQPPEQIEQGVESDGTATLVGSP